MSTPKRHLEAFGEATTEAYAAIFAEKGVDMPPMITWFKDGYEILTMMAEDPAVVEDHFGTIVEFAINLGRLFVMRLEADAVSFAVTGLIKMMDEGQKELPEDYAKGDYNKEYAEDPDSGITEAIVITAANAEGLMLVQLTPLEIADQGVRILGETKIMDEGSAGTIPEMMAQFWALDNRFDTHARTIEDITNEQIFEQVAKMGVVVMDKRDG